MAESGFYYVSSIKGFNSSSINKVGNVDIPEIMEDTMGVIFGKWGF